MLLRRKTHVFLYKEKISSNSDQRPFTADYQLNITYRPFLTEMSEMPVAAIQCPVSTIKQNFGT
jgi:hypothetical protein